MENYRKLFNSLTYTSYATNRDNGVTHNQLVSIGLGNEEMRVKYESKSEADMNTNYPNVKNKLTHF